MTKTQARFEPLAAQHQLASQDGDAKPPTPRWWRSLASSSAGLIASMAMLGFLVFSLAVLFALSLKVTFGLMIGGSVLMGLAAASAGD